MAEANEKLKQQLEEAPEGHFDIQNVDEAERVIEMVSVAQYDHLCVWVGGGGSVCVCATAFS